MKTTNKQRLSRQQHYYNLPKILGRIQKNWGGFMSLRLQWKTTNGICTTVTSVLVNDTPKLLWKFDIQTDTLISARRLGLMIINKKERTCRIVDLAIPGDHKVKLKEHEKSDKYLDFARELKNPWNITETFVLIVLAAFGTVTKGFVQGLEDLEISGWVEISKLQHFRDLSEYWEESWGF